MKQRLLVMNGQRIVQSEQGGAWINEKVDKAGAIKPGIYNLHMALPADKSQRYVGVILHTDNDKVYQQAGKSLVMHSRSDFDRGQAIGLEKSITYDAQGKATVSAEVAQLGRGRSR
jgi:hypothetical protein